MQKTEQWGIFELPLKGKEERNPFVDVHLGAQFQFQNRKVEVEGFYDGDGIFKLRFMPDRVGVWSYTSQSNRKELDGVTGQLECVPAMEGNHGPVHVKDRLHFTYEDGTPFVPFGTTCYAWTHQEKELEEKTLQTLANSPFNKLRMCVFPKHYAYNQNEPVYNPFEGSLEEGWDFSRFQPEFFRHLEERITDLMKLGIEADLILFHPYDRWGYSSMSKETNQRYLRYIVSRLASFRNVWWSFANEYDLMKQFPMSDWDDYFRLVQEEDPFQHLRSIHNCRLFYDYGRPWVTHCSIQSSDLTKVSEWLETYQKPVIVDECRYEGNISRYWGNIAACEMVYRIWEGTVRGGYVGHGETFVDPKDILWWAKGGTLHGQSPERISFLRGIMEEAPRDLEPVWIGKDTRAAIGKENRYFLAYYGISQSVYKDLCLPEGRKYKMDVIDTWNMTISPVGGIFKGNCRVTLPGKQYIALRIREV